MPPSNQRRRPPVDDDGVPRFEKSKTVKMNPVAAIFLFVSPVILGIVVVVLYLNKQAPKEADPEVIAVEEGEDWHAIYKKDLAKAKKLYRDAMRVRNSEAQEAYKKAWQKTADSAFELIDRLEVNLEDYRDENGELKEGYRGYNHDYQELQELRHDLLKTEPLDLTD